MKKVKTVPIKYPADLIHIDHWMCSKCGLIFDFSPDEVPDGLGWIAYDPPLDHIDFWIDNDGNYHVEEMKRREICPRCSNDLNENPLIRVFISPLIYLNDIKPIIEQGEGWKTEFMAVFPNNAQELTKEIAAFATTRGGRILLGIDNNGHYVGLHEIDTPKGKDDLQKRIRGLIGRIEPKVELYVDFISEESIHIAIITVPKGFAAFYTSEGKPYIRDLEASRVATPEEVTRLVENWQKHRTS